jgi:hypothetical protein
MKKKQNSPDDMLSEYDFSGAQRNPFAARLKKEGYSIRVYKADGSYTERHVLKESTVELEPEVQAYFPDSKAVNDALRKVISLFPANRKPAAKRQLSAKGTKGRRRQ